MVSVVRRQVSIVTLTFLLFLYLYNPKVTLISSGFMRYLLLFLILAHLRLNKVIGWFRQAVRSVFSGEARSELLERVRLAGRKDSTRIIGWVVMYLGFLVFYFFTVPVVLNTYDFTVFFNLFMIFAVLLPIAYLLLAYMDRTVGSGLTTVLYLVSFAIFLQSLFILLEWFSPAFSDFTYSIVSKKPMFLRASGLSSSAGDGLSMIQASGAMASFYLYMFVEQRWKNKLALVVMFLAQLLSIVFVGRTGFVLLFAFAASSFLFEKVRFREVKKILGMVTVACVIVYVLYQWMIPDELKNLMETRLFPWAFEFVYSWVERGSLATSSTTDIWENMIFLPHSEKTLFFGDGLFVDPVNAEFNYMDTDSGYIRFIFLPACWGPSYFTPIFSCSCIS